MAIIAEGRIVLQGVPHELIAALAGRVWRRTIDRAGLDACRREFNVISTRLREGRTVIHVIVDDRPGPEFEPVEAVLEDVYFATLAAHRRGGTERLAA
jgi:hypothetical protein